MEIIPAWQSIVLLESRRVNHRVHGQCGDAFKHLMKLYSLEFWLIRVRLRVYGDKRKNIRVWLTFIPLSLSPLHQGCLPLLRALLPSFASTSRLVKNGSSQKSIERTGTRLSWEKILPRTLTKLDKIRQLTFHYRSWNMFWGARTETREVCGASGCCLWPFSWLCVPVAKMCDKYWHLDTPAASIPSPLTRMQAGNSHFK